MSTRELKDRASSAVRETYREIVGPEDLGRLKGHLDALADSVSLDPEGLVEDLAAVVQVLHSVGGAEAMDQGRSLVKAPATRALVALKDHVQGARNLQHRAALDSEARREGVRLTTPPAVLALFDLAAQGLYDVVIQDDYPSEEDLVGACARELRWLAGAFDQVEDAVRAKVARDEAERLEVALREMPDLVAEARDFATCRMASGRVP